MCMSLNPSGSASFLVMSMLEIFDNPLRQMVWGKPRTSYNKENAKSTVKYRGGSLMHGDVWRLRKWAHFVLLRDK